MADHFQTTDPLKGNRRKQIRREYAIREQQSHQAPKTINGKRRKKHLWDIPATNQEK